MENNVKEIMIFILKYLLKTMKELIKGFLY